MTYQYAPRITTERVLGIIERQGGIIEVTPTEVRLYCPPGSVVADVATEVVREREPEIRALRGSRR